MDTIFVNSKNSKTSEPHRLLINHADKLDLKRSDKYVALSNLRMYCTWKNIKYHTKTNLFTISSTTWCKNLDILHGSYHVSDIQDYFEYIIKKLETVTNNSSTKIYGNKIENRITFEIKTGYYMKL